MYGVVVGIVFRLRLHTLSLLAPATRHAQLLSPVVLVFVHANRAGTMAIQTQTLFRARGQNRRCQRRLVDTVGCPTEKTLDSVGPVVPDVYAGVVAATVCRQRTEIVGVAFRDGLCNFALDDAALFHERFQYSVQGVLYRFPGSRRRRRGAPFVPHAPVPRALFGAGCQDRCVAPGRTGVRRGDSFGAVFELFVSPRDTPERISLVVGVRGRINKNAHVVVVRFRGPVERTDVCTDIVWRGCVVAAVCGPGHVVGADRVGRNDDLRVASPGALAGLLFLSPVAGTVRRGGTGQRQCGVCGHGMQLRFRPGVLFRLYGRLAAIDNLVSRHWGAPHGRLGPEFDVGRRSLATMCQAVCHDRIGVLWVQFRVVGVAVGPETMLGVRLK